MSAQVYQSKLVQDSYDAIVIGSGIGGLSTAAFLAKQGQRVLVLEQHYVAGGFTHTFSRKGYEWDVGVHYIGEVHRKNSVLRKVFDYLTDSNLKWAFMDDTYDKVIIKNKTYEYVAGYKNFKEQMCQYFPGEEQAIEGYLQKLFEVTKATQDFFALKAMPPLMSSVMSPVKAGKFLQNSNRTTKDVIQSLTNNPELIGVLTAQYGDYGLPPAQSSFAIHAMVAKHYLEGGNYPIGGSAQFFNTMNPIIEAAGGRTLVKASVQEILFQGRKTVGVKMASGDKIYAPIVVSSAGVINTFGKLIPNEAPLKATFKKQLKQVQPSLSHICLYVGLKHSQEELKLPRYNYWIYPDYDHDQNIQTYLQNPDSDLPVTYISFPSAKDPDFENRHPGRSTIEVIGFTPYEWFKKWEGTAWKKRGRDYEAYKEDLAQKLLQKLYQYVPQVKGKIDYYELSTPLSTRHFCDYDQGEIYGIDHTPERFRLKWLRPHTPIKNLYLTGQDIVTDGIGGALFAGVLTASAICKKNLLKGVLKS